MDRAFYGHTDLPLGTRNKVRRLITPTAFDIVPNVRSNFFTELHEAT